MVVPRDVPLVVTEGNHLLQDGPFGVVRALLTEAFVDVEPVGRHSQLVGRHACLGRAPDEAEPWVETIHEPNGRVVERTSAAADLVAQLPS